MFPLLCFSDIHDRMESKRSWWAWSTRRLKEVRVKVHDSHPRSSISISDNRGNMSNPRHVGDVASLVANAPNRNNCHDQSEDDDGSDDDGDDKGSTVQSRGSVDSRRSSGSSGATRRGSFGAPSRGLSRQPSDLIAAGTVARRISKLLNRSTFEPELEPQYMESNEDVGSFENELATNGVSQESILDNGSEVSYAHSQQSSMPYFETVGSHHSLKSDGSQLSERGSIEQDRLSVQSNQRRGTQRSIGSEGPGGSQISEKGSHTNSIEKDMLSAQSNERRSTQRSIGSEGPGDSQMPERSSNTSSIETDRLSVQSNQRRSTQRSIGSEGSNLGPSSISITKPSASGRSIRSGYSENHDQSQPNIDKDLENNVNDGTASRLSRMSGKALSFAASAISRKSGNSQKSEQSDPYEKHDSFGSELYGHMSRRDPGRESRMTSRARQLSLSPALTSRFGSRQSSFPPHMIDNTGLEMEKNDSTCMQEIREKVKYIAALVERDDCGRGSRPSKVTSPRSSKVTSYPTEVSEPIYDQNLPNQLQHDQQFQEAISFLSDKCKADYIIAEVENLKRMERCMNSPDARQRAPSVRNPNVTQQSLLNDASNFDYVRESLRKISEYVQGGCTAQHGYSAYRAPNPQPNQSSPLSSYYQSFLNAPTEGSNPLMSQPCYPLNPYPMCNACQPQPQHVQPYQQEPCRLVDPSIRQARSHMTSESSFLTANTHISNRDSHDSSNHSDQSYRSGRSHPPLDESIPPREPDANSPVPHEEAPRSCSRSSNARSSSCGSSTTSATLAVLVVVLLFVAIFLSSFILSFEFLKSSSSLHVKRNITKHVEQTKQAEKVVHVEPAQKTCEHKKHRMCYRKTLTKKSEIQLQCQKHSKAGSHADTPEFRLLVQKVARYLIDKVDDNNTDVKPELKIKKQQTLDKKQKDKENKDTEYAENAGNSQNVEDQKTKNDKVNGQEPTQNNGAHYEHDENDKQWTDDTIQQSSRLEEQKTRVSDCSDQDSSDIDQDTTVCEHRTQEPNLEDATTTETVDSDQIINEVVNHNSKKPTDRDNTTGDHTKEEDRPNENNCETCKAIGTVEDEEKPGCASQKVTRDCWWLESIFKPNCYYRRNMCG